jgi:hypothetical protein
VERLLSLGRAVPLDFLARHHVGLHLIRYQSTLYGKQRIQLSSTAL